jgi:hypothetical protein
VTTLRVFKPAGPCTWEWRPSPCSWVLVAWEGAPARLYGGAGPFAAEPREFPTPEAAEAHAIAETRRVGQALLDACPPCDAAPGPRTVFEGLRNATPEEIAEQRESFARGNLAIDRDPDARRTVRTAAGDIHGVGAAVIDADEETPNLDANGAPYPRAGILPACGKRCDCGGSCALLPDHGGRCECVGDDRGWPGTCPA